MYKKDKTIIFWEFSKQFFIMMMGDGGTIIIIFYTCKSCEYKINCLFALRTTYHRGLNDIVWSNIHTASVRRCHSTHSGVIWIQEESNESHQERFQKLLSYYSGVAKNYFQMTPESYKPIISYDAWSSCWRDSFEINTPARNSLLN